jgi:hypothetical protein
MSVERNLILTELLYNKTGFIYMDKSGDIIREKELHLTAKDKIYPIRCEEYTDDLLELYDEEFINVGSQKEAALLRALRERREDEKDEW